MAIVAQVTHIQCQTRLLLQIILVDVVEAHFQNWKKEASIPSSSVNNLGRLLYVHIHLYCLQNCKLCFDRNLSEYVHHCTKFGSERIGCE